MKIKPGVVFVAAPGGQRILDALMLVEQHLGLELTVTSGADGEHSGPADPHHRGDAYDVRSHDVPGPQKDQILALAMHALGWDRFFGFLEAAGTPNEHFHFQVKKGTAYSFADYLTHPLPATLQVAA